MHTAAFPVALADDVRIATAVMPTAGFPALAPFTVSVDGESVTIPSRIHHPEPSAADERGLSPRQAAILGCLYTRHDDGYVRERRLEQVLPIAEPWVVPFIVQLVGEYVLEILIKIDRGLSDIDAADAAHCALYRNFLGANPEFLARTRRRVVSYWNAYYRQDYPDFGSYPGNDLLTRLLAMARG